MSNGGACAPGSPPPPTPRVILGAQAGEIAGSKIPSVALPDAGVYSVDPSLPYAVLFNTDTVTHTVTITPRFGGTVSGINLPQAAIPVAVPPGSSYPFPASTFGTVSDAQGNGTLYLYHSDVPPPGFKPAAGSGATPVSVFVDNIVTTADSPGVMGGWGTDGPLVLTPTKTGNVLFIMTGRWNVVGGAGAGDVQLAYGTGTPPMNGDPKTGTLVGIDFSSNAPGTSDVPICLHVVILGLTLGVKYWFDGVAYQVGGGGTEAQLAEPWASVIEV